MWQDASGFTQRVLALWDMDNLAEDAWTPWQSPANNCHLMNQNVSTGRWEAEESAKGLYTVSSWQKIHTDFLKKKIEKMNPFLNEESKVMKSHLKKKPLNQTGIRQKKPGGNAILKEVLIIQGVMKTVSVIGSQVAEMEERRI